MVYMVSTKRLNSRVTMKLKRRNSGNFVQSALVPPFIYPSTKANLYHCFLKVQ